MGLVPRLYALIEVASVRGLIQIPPRRESVQETSSPVLTRYWPPPVWAESCSWLVAFTMLYILLVFAFWGLFIY